LSNNRGLAEQHVASPNPFPFPIRGRTLNQLGQSKVVDSPALSVPGQIVRHHGHDLRQVHIQRKLGVGGEFCRTYHSLWALFVMCLKGKG
jgi:hypothetical protein